MSAASQQPQAGRAPTPGAGVTSGPSDDATEGARRPRRWPWIVGALVAVAIVVAIGAPPTDVPYDPDGVGPTGLRGVVDLLTAVDVEVSIALDPPDDTDARAFVPIDLLTSQRHEAWRDWVRRGGTLVVAGQGSALHDLDGVGDPLGGLGVTERQLRCEGPSLDAVDRIAQSSWPGLTVPGDASSCLEVDDGFAWLVVRTVGDGTIVALGSAEAFTNGLLDRADNAVLAGALLGPAAGDRLVIVPRPPVGAGDTALLDLVAPRVWQGLLVLTVAVLLALVAVGRRHGPPVAERLPPVVAAAELAASVGDLLQRAGDRDAAARRLRADARSVVGRALGLPASTPPARLAELAVARSALRTEVATTALVDAPIDADDALVELARCVQEVRARLAPGDVDRGPA